MPKLSSFLAQFLSLPIHSLTISLSLSLSLSLSQQGFNPFIIHYYLLIDFPIVPLLYTLPLVLPLLCIHLTYSACPSVPLLSYLPLFYVYVYCILITVRFSLRRFPSHSCFSLLPFYIFLLHSINFHTVILYPPLLIIRGRYSPEHIPLLLIFVYLLFALPSCLARVFLTLLFL